VKAQNDSYRVSETRRLVGELPNNEVALSPDIKNFKAAKWRLASSLAVLVLIRPPTPVSGHSKPATKGRN
jgi:hypothetical protein